jgi:hypothetical protein
VQELLVVVLIPNRYTGSSAARQVFVDDTMMLDMDGRRRCKSVATRLKYSTRYQIIMSRTYLRKSYLYLQYNEMYYKKQQWKNSYMQCNAMQCNAVSSYFLLLAWWPPLLFLVRILLCRGTVTCNMNVASELTTHGAA